MMDERDIERALTAAAPLLGAQRLTRLAEDRWTLVDVRGDEVSIVLDGTLPRLVLAADVAPLPSAGRLRACEMLLACGPASPARPGPHAALDLDRDVAVFLLVLPLAGLADRALAEAIGGLLGVSRAMSRALDGLASAEGGDPRAATQGVIQA